MPDEKELLESALDRLCEAAENVVMLAPSGERADLSAHFLTRAVFLHDLIQNGGGVTH